MEATDQILHCEMEWEQEGSSVRTLGMKYEQCVVVFECGVENLHCGQRGGK